MGNVFGNRFTTYLFLALDQEFEIDGQPAAMYSTQSFNCLNMHVHLALVVTRAAGIDVAVANTGLEWRRFPKLNRIRRLNVVMPIAEDSRLAGGVKPIGIDKGVFFCRDHLHVFESGTL